MSSLYKLITKTNFKSPIIMFPLIMPLIMMLLYSVMVPATDAALLTAENTLEAQAYVNSIFFTVLAITTMQSGLMGFGFNFMNLKKSVMLKRIGASNMSKTEVLGAVLLYGVTVWAISLVWMFILANIFSAAGMFWTASSVDATQRYVLHIQFFNTEVFHYGKIILATIIGVYLSYAMGALFVSISHDINAFQGFVMMYFFATSILGGLMIPVMSQTNWMRYISFLMPHSYFADMFTWATNSEVWSQQWTSIGVNTNAKLAADFIVPIVVGTLALWGAIKFLKFD